MAAKVDEHIENIDAIERGSRIKVISIVVVAALVFVFLFIYRPDITQEVSEGVVESVKNFTSKIKQEEEKPELVEAPEVIENHVAEEAAKPGIVLGLSTKHTFKGKSIILTYVHSKETYCMFRVDGESGLVTNNSQRTINGINVKVYEPVKDPESCRVELS